MCRSWSEDDLASVLGSDGYENGFLDPRGGNLQPLSYARGLAFAAVRNGAMLHARSQALRIERDGEGWRVHTPTATVSAEHVLIATNGYTDNLWAGLQQSVVPVCSYLLASAPLSPNVLGTVLPGRHAVSESSNVIVYYRLDAKGRLIFGGRGNHFDLRGHGDTEHLKRRAVELFPALKGVAWEYQWHGYPAITRDGLPKLLRLAKGVHAGLGYNGRGVGMATMMGKQLAQVALEGRSDLDVAPASQFALHAFRQIGVSARLVGGQLIDWYQRRSYRAERATAHRNSNP